MKQGDFFAGYDIRWPETRLEELGLEFARYHAANPQVWRLFVRFTTDLIRRGFEHYSADAVLHRIRWHTDVETRSPEEFKINNNYTAEYARMFHQLYPEHAGFFRTRRRRSAQQRPRRGRHA